MASHVSSSRYSAINQDPEHDADPETSTDAEPAARLLGTRAAAECGNDDDDDGALLAMQRRAQRSSTLGALGVLFGCIGIAVGVVGLIRGGRGHEDRPKVPQYFQTTPQLYVGPSP